MIDFVWAARNLRRSPRFALLVTGMLALGIGGTTAVFAAVDAVLFRSLPFREPDRLVNVFGTNPSLEGGRSVLSPADFEVLKQSGAFESVAVAFTPAQGLGVKLESEPELVRGTWMSAELLDTLGVKPFLGRGPGAEDARPESEKTVVLGYDYWRRRFGGKVGAIGSRLTVEGDPHTIIGVMPPGLRIPLRDPADVLATLQLAPATRQGPFYLEGTARLRRDAAPAEVETALASAAARLRERFPGGSDFHYLTPSMQDTAVAGARLGLLLLFGAVALVLLIVCANVGILMLARGQARARELAIRAALGASRRRLAGQLLAESAILATAGVALGLLVAAWATDALQALRPGSLPSARIIAIDGRGIVFAALVAVAACVLFGVLPALLTTRSLESLRESVGTSPRRQRARRVLVTAELALTLVLLVGAGLLGKSLLELERVRPGFRPEGVLSFQLNLPEARYADDKQVVAFYEDLLHQIEGMPGVQAAAATMSVPPDWLVMSNDFFLPDRPPAAGEPAPVAPFIFVSPEYFRAVGVTLLDGRGFTPADRAGAPPVVVISEAMARRYFGGDAVGKRIGIGPPGPDAAIATVVGVVNDVKYRGLDSRDDAAMYAPFRQLTWRDMFVVVRTAGEPERLLGPVRRVLAGVDSDLAMREVRTLEDRMQRSVAEPRYRAVLLIAFGLMALVLAVLGVYGVMAHMVGRRQREIAIRMAVGGRPRDILRLVAVEAGALTLIGLVVGGAASIALGRLIGGLLFGVAPHDPIIYTAAAAVLFVGAALACYLPARRAMRVEPMTAMRGE